MSETTDDLSLKVVVHLPAHPYSIGLARGLVRGMHPLIDAEQLERAELIVSEIMTNAVRHGTETPEDIIDFELVAKPALLQGKVSDSGPSFVPPTALPQLGQAGGFGLHIVDRLASSWQVERSGKGNDVHFSV